MAIMKKGRRKIIVEDVDYYWNVEQDYDSEYQILSIVSNDKKLIISCPLRMKKMYVISKGSIFKCKKSDGFWNRYLLPFAVPQTITPKIVSRIILWAIQDDDATKVDWDGKDIVV